MHGTREGQRKDEQRQDHIARRQKMLGRERHGPERKREHDGIDQQLDRIE